MRDVRPGTAGRKAKPKPFALPGLPPPKAPKAPPRRVSFPGAPGGLRVQKPKAPKIPVVHTAGPARPPKVAPKRPVVTTKAPVRSAPAHSAPVAPRRPTAGAMPPPPRRVPTKTTTPRRVVQASSPGVSPADQAAADEQAYIDAIIGPGQQQINYLRRQQQQQDQQRTANIQALTNQFLSYLSGVPGQVQQDYTNAQNTQMNLAREGQQALANASTNPAVQSDLQAIGAPQAQQNQVADKLSSAFQGGGAVLLGTGGTIPTSQLASDQAAQLAFVRSLPAVASSAGQQTLNNYLNRSQRAYSDLAQKESQLLAQVPKLRLDYQSQAASNAAKQAQLDIERQAFHLKAQNQAFSQAATKARINQSAASLKLRASQQNIANAMRFAEIYGYDPKTGKPTLAAIKAAKADAKKSKKPPSASALKNWNLFAEDAYHGVPAKTRYDSSTGKFVPIPPYRSINGVLYSKPPIQYYPALKKLLAMGANLAQAQKVLNALWAKGEGGRPYVSLQGRIALQKAGMPLNGTNSVPSQAQINYLRQHGLWGD